MKIEPRAVDGFLKQPDPAVRVVLLFGPDQGMVLERSRALGRTVVDDLADPFAVVDLSESDLKDDPVRLGDEARALSFGGGRRLVRVRGGGEPVADALKRYLEAPGDGSLVIVEAGDLAPKAALRATCEKEKLCASIGCYADHGGGLATLIRQALADADVSVDRDAVDLMCAHLAEDRGIVRGEIEKLILYVGPGGKVGVDDVTACLTDAAAVSLDRLVFACGDGNAGEVDQLTRRAFDEGVSEIALLRALQQHFTRLEWVVAQGPDAASRLRPPVFFRFKDRFQAQARGWSLTAIRRALAALTEAEIGCKSGIEPAPLVCSRALLAVTSHAPKRASRR
ncbi:MAG: DNA polymerase III subunit delta [Rhodospirillales bacterium]